MVLAGVAIPALADNQYVYIRSNTDVPWGQSTNEDAMNNVPFPAGWTTMYYETVDPNVLLSSSTLFIFMEGGDSSFDSFQSFVTTNGDALAAWIQNGGKLLIMSAPNDPLSPATVSLPDNITLHSDAFYQSAATEAWGVNNGNQIFKNPNNIYYDFTGNFFAHGYFTGSNVGSLMVSNLSEVVLGQDEIGSGLMVFGGMTTDNFQLPQPDAHLLLENIIYYTALGWHN